MKKAYTFIALLIAFLFVSTSLFAKITVESTKGDAAYKKGKQWVPLAKGQTLEEGVKISTGAKSWVELNIDGDSVRINQLTMMKVFTNKITKDDKNTHIGLKHGSLESRIRKIGTLKTNFKITTPVATSSVRGTSPFDSNGAKSGYYGFVREGKKEVVDSIGHSSHIEGNLVCQLDPNDAKPKNLLLNVKNNSIPNITNPNVTKEEIQTLEFTGLGTVIPNEDPGQFVQLSPPSPATVNLQISW